MPAPCSYSYAVVRVVPDVEREDFVNAGVVLLPPHGGVCDAPEREIERLLARLVRLQP